MKKVLAILVMAILINGCATPREMGRVILGISTKDIEDSRKDAVAKVFNEDLKTCYARMEDILKKIPRVSIYDKNDHMIAVYYIHPNDTPIGLFFTQLDPAQTKVEVSSPSSTARDDIAKIVFADVVKE